MSEDQESRKSIVFIDSQNVYQTAREAYGWGTESSRRGNFRPLAFGQLLTQEPDRELREVRVYTGIPSQERDLQGYRASRKRFDTWKHEGRGIVQVCERNLRYQPGEPPREKGVDVLLAIHLVRLAAMKKFDLAIVLSADNDLVPALELVADMLGAAAIESVSLRAEPGCESAPALGVEVTAKRLQIARRLIDRVDYERIEDQRSYNPNNPNSVPDPGVQLPGQSGRQLPRFGR